MTVLNSRCLAGADQQHHALPPWALRQLALTPTSFLSTLLFFSSGSLLHDTLAGESILLLSLEDHSGLDLDPLIGPTFEGTARQRVRNPAQRASKGTKSPTPYPTSCCSGLLHLSLVGGLSPATPPRSCVRYGPVI